jgi:putative oxidoreductase
VETNTKIRLPLVLLLLRWSVFLVMLMWTLDKLVRPEHAAAVYQNFYFIGNLGNGVMYVIGAVQLLIILGFVLGLRKTITYGAVLFFHTISTVSSFKQYFAPFQDGNLLFFAAWPMLAACFALFYLRDWDTIATLNPSKPWQ